MVVVGEAEARGGAALAGAIQEGGDPAIALGGQVLAQRHALRPERHQLLRGGRDQEARPQRRGALDRLVQRGGILGIEEAVPGRSREAERLEAAASLHRRAAEQLRALDLAVAELRECLERAIEVARRAGSGRCRARSPGRSGACRAAWLKPARFATLPRMPDASQLILLPRPRRLVAGTGAGAPQAVRPTSGPTPRSVATPSRSRSATRACGSATARAEPGATPRRRCARSALQSGATLPAAPHRGRAGFPGARLHARRESRPRAHARDARAPRRPAGAAAPQPPRALHRAQLRLPRSRDGLARRLTAHGRRRALARRALSGPRHRARVRTRTASVTWAAGSSTRHTARAPRRRTASARGSASRCRPACSSRPRTTPRSRSRSAASCSRTTRAAASTSAATRPSSSGRGKSQARVEAHGRGRVYLDHLLRLLRPLQREGNEVLFWGDILRHHPELVPELPKEGTIACAWHYEAPQSRSRCRTICSRCSREFGIDRASFAGFATTSMRSRAPACPTGCAPARRAGTR